MIFCFCSHFLYSQTTHTISYTTKEGLSSNSVYRSVIDRKGFLWIATENGLARFDGRRFETYTTAKGLTDNEIIELFCDSSGIIWAIPFRRSPCYYNPQKDRFENEKTDLELRKIDLANTHAANLLDDGGMAFSNNFRTLYIYKKGKTTEYKNFMDLKTGAIQRVVEYGPGQFIFFCEDSIRYFSNGKITKNIPFGKKIIAVENIGNKIYLAQEKSITQLSLGKNGEFVIDIEKEYPFEIRIFCFTGKEFAITSLSGNTYLVDRSSLELKGIIYSGVQVRNVLQDKEGNIWLSTMEKGLVKIQQKRISSYSSVPLMLQNFNALIKTKNIITGNNNGEVFVYDGLYAVRKVPLTDNKNIDAWVRKIVETPQGIFVSTQTGSFLFDNDCRQEKKRFIGAVNKASKTALLLNDSTLGLGTHAQAMKYNLNTGKYTDSILKRVISLAISRTGKIYIGSNDGLYRWDKDSLYSFGKKQTAFNYRVNTMTCSPDNILWVGLGSDSLLVLKEDKLIASLPLGANIPGNICKSLFCNKPGEIWLGTNKGLNRINYALSNDKFSYNNTYFGESDGLIGEQVNDITIKNDTVYVATSGGISYLPANLSLPVADISTFITRINISGKDEELKESYSLPFSKNDVTIEFSGVDLTGFIPRFEYSTNNSSWQRTEKIELKRLSPGSYKIKIRAIKRDGTASSQEAAVSITIKTPFWKNPVFWTIFILLSFSVIIYFVQRRNRQRQKAALEKVITEKKIAELEMQALKAQINPHFVFNCLNSIKGFIYDKDYRQADKYLDKFSELLRSTMDNSDASIISLEDEIKYLDTYLQLEKLRFADKFDYSIRADDDIEITKTFVPAMLLQPYVENAIRHGVRFLENKKGIITISARKENGLLICEIEDNGIGREKAAELKSAKHIEYQSRGMQLSKRRAELFGISQQVVDKMDEQGNLPAGQASASGTKIILSIPLSLKP
ncbi:MAG: histidine kinase [Sphingobacteriales bacterium]|nr:histidine kinase [Sphingobacteriales bacterium]